MTIKEVEERTGLTRANIRFYEAEGLLTPTRHENGYREYAEEDLELLLRIRLLRTLRVPLAEIKALQAGQAQLSEVLERHLDWLQREQNALSQSQEVCQSMCRDGARFETLDAGRYLAALAQLSQRSVPDADAVEPVRAPWRRFFARYLDIQLCSMLWNMVLGVCKVNLTSRTTGLELLDCIVAILLVLLLEPFFLSRLGTTPGKWVFGLGVTDLDGGRLTYRAAVERTKWAIWRGLGFYLPIYNLVRLWKSYRACSDGQTLDWEDDSAVTLREKSPWFTAAGVADLLAVVIGVTALAIGFSELPWHRGDLSVAEFCENYNQQARHYRMENGYLLDEEGRWTEKPDATYIFGTDSDLPAFVFTEEDGSMTGLRFTVELRDADDIQYGYRDQVLLAVLAFLRAQPGGGLFSKEARNAVRQIESSSLQDYSFTACGVEIQYEIRYSGYTAVESMHALWPEEDAQTYYAVSFSMQKR